MAKYTIEDSTLTAIADAVRTQEGTGDAIPVSEIAERIGNLSGSGSGGTTYDITLDVESGSFDLYCGGYSMQGLTSGDNPGSIQLTGEQCIAVIVYSESGYVSGSGCVGGCLFSTYNSDMNGTLFILPVTGESTAGTISITDH